MKNKKELFWELFLALIPVIISALGAALMVFSSYDDSPGGSLLGLLMILFSGFLILQTRRKRS